MKNTIKLVPVLITALFLSHAALATEELFIPLGTTGKPAKIVTVSAQGGDFIDPVAAVASITDATAENRYLVLIVPGIYTIKETLVMKPFVDITGAGREVTVLKGAISSAAANITSAIVSGADSATLRDFSIENTGGGDFSLALYNMNSSPVIQDMQVKAYGATDNYGVYNHASSPYMNNVIAIVSGGNPGNSYGKTYGVYNSSASPKMVNVRVDVGGAGMDYGVYNLSSSPTMTDGTVTAHSESSCTGVYNDTSNPIMTRLTVTALASAQGTGVFNVDSSPIMTDVSVTASGGHYGYGIESSSSFPVIRQSTVKVDSETNRGIYVIGGITRVLQSSIIGGVYVDPARGGTLTCVYSDNGIATALSSSCE